jgi:hypothetical protein
MWLLLAIGVIFVTPSKHRAEGNERPLQHFYLPRHSTLPRRGGYWRLIHEGFVAIDALSADFERRKRKRKRNSV